MLQSTLRSFSLFLNIWYRRDLLQLITGNNLQYIQRLDVAAVIHEACFSASRKKKLARLKAFKEMVRTDMAGCALGVIAPLTLQTENLIKCDTED